MYIVQELGVFAIETLLTRLYVSIDILLIWRTLAWRIMLLRGEDWTYTTDLIPSLFIEVTAPRNLRRNMIHVRH
jgi:hypothetical protein